MLVTDSKVSFRSLKKIEKRRKKIGSKGCQMVIIILTTHLSPMYISVRGPEMSSLRSFYSNNHALPIVSL